MCLLGPILIYIVDGCGIGLIFIKAREVPEEDLGAAVADCEDGVRDSSRKGRAEAEPHVEFEAAWDVELEEPYILC